MEWMLMPLRRWSDFSGRSRRKEYWMFVLLNIILAIGTNIVDSVLGMTGMVFGLYGPVTCLLFLALLVPSVAVAIRRMHDQDKSGWFVLLVLIPVANLVFLVFMLLEGTRGPNRFGPDPKGGIGGGGSDPLMGGPQQI